MPRPLIATALLLLAASACGQDEPFPDGARLPRLVAGGGPQPHTLQLVPPGHAVDSFRLAVPADTRVLRITLRCETVDLDLYVSPWDDPDDVAPADEEVDGGPGTEDVVLDRFGAPPLRTGRYLVEVEWHADDRPRWAGRRLDAVPYTLDVELLPTRIDGVLAMDTEVSATLDDATGRFHTWRIDVPEGAQALRVDLTDTPGDLDLRLTHGAPAGSPDQADHAAVAAYGRESLVITADSTPPLRPGPWFVDVAEVDASGLPPVPFTLLVSRRAEPPERLLAVPDLHRPADDRLLTTALSAVLELASPAGQGDFAGSGVLVSPDGWLLTNAHVVQGFGSGALREVVASASLDDRQPPVELFRGAVVEFDTQRDLALVHLTSGLYGQPLPEGYRFPCLPLGGDDADGIARSAAASGSGAAPSAASGALAIGDPLWFVGYPTTGGAGTRNSITATRGVVSGFERSPFGVWIKSDAEIASGNSGGAALDALGRLVGVPSSLVEDGSSQLAYVVPVSALPAAWLARIVTGR